LIYTSGLFTLKPLTSRKSLTIKNYYYTCNKKLLLLISTYFVKPEGARFFTPVQTDPQAHTTSWTVYSWLLSWV